MDSKLYKFFYESLNSYEDVEELSQKHGVCIGTLSCILDQKVIGNVKKSYYGLQLKKNKLVKEWDRGSSFSDLAKKYDYPATLISSLILQNIGYNKRQIRDCYRDPALVENARIRKELGESLNTDYFFSPRAHRLHEKKGKTGEKLISCWLQKLKCDFKCEDDMRANGLTGKTPDFLMEKSIRIRDAEVCWIESKALFGELKEHRNYAKKQFSEYSKCYGDGLVVYWFGFETDILKEKEDGYQVADFELFKNDFPEDVSRFLTYMTRW
ncbi:MAG: C15orf41 family protein [Methanimicrococcus sp.]|nr:C15orf41 family protein [Methanimicrococcus sp.]